MVGPAPLYLYLIDVEKDLIKALVRTSMATLKRHNALKAFNNLKEIINHQPLLYLADGGAFLFILLLDPSFAPLANEFQ